MLMDIVHRYVCKLGKYSWYAVDKWSEPSLIILIPVTNVCVVIELNPHLVYSPDVDKEGRHVEL